MSGQDQPRDHHLEDLELPRLSRVEERVWDAATAQRRRALERGAPLDAEPPVADVRLSGAEGGQRYW